MLQLHWENTFMLLWRQKWGPLSFLWWSDGHPLTSFKQWTLSLLNPLPSCAYSALTKHIVPHLRPNSSTTVFVSQLHFTFIRLTFERSSYIHLWRLGCILKFIAVHAKLSLKVKWAKTMGRVWKGTLSLFVLSFRTQPTYIEQQCPLSRPLIDLTRHNNMFCVEQRMHV